MLRSIVGGGAAMGLGERREGRGGCGVRVGGGLAHDLGGGRPCGAQAWRVGVARGGRAPPLRGYVLLRVSLYACVRACVRVHVLKGEDGSMQPAGGHAEP